ncbi:MAG: SDR family oxidoreductase [Candidatus Cloacimonadales bacterium]|nr:SDR family oxidoreductase [Candidatus Cloacimonadales bacterium]
MVNFDFTDKKVLISGGSKGIGAVTAISFAQAGADICIIGRNHDDMVKVQDAVLETGRKCQIIQQDISSWDGAQIAAQKALYYSDHWDILVNNAGIAIQSPILEIKPQHWNKTFSVNLEAAVAISQIIVPQMIARKSGKIVNVSSMGAFFGTPGLGSYAASKAALNQLTRTMAVEWGQYNIQVNTVCPTIILTKLGEEFWKDPNRVEQRQAKEARIPLHRFGQPQDVADTILYLASSAADFITGVSLPLDGGMQVSP